MKKLKNKKTLISVLSGLFVILVVFYAWPGNTLAPDGYRIIRKPHVSNTQSAKNPQQFDKTRYPVDEASSMWVVVNKGRVLPSDYVPAELVVPDVPLRLAAGASEMHLRKDAASALETMFNQAKKEGIGLMLASGYRSYNEQSVVYNGYVSQSGISKADTFSARPGHSEHQTGLAADVEPLSRTCEVDQCFENTKEGQWLAANSYKFGFIVRYQKYNQPITGYEYEPWHIRYIGVELAEELQKDNQTLEQFFGLPSYAGYPSQSMQLKS